MSRVRMIYQIGETRLRILEMAQRLFVEKGLFATQMQDVARELNISRTSLYRYYQDKCELATAILAKLIGETHSAWEEIASKSPPKKNGLARVEFFIREYWASDRFAVAHAYFAEYDAFFSGARLTDNVSDGLAKSLQGDRVAYLTEALQAGIRDGSVKPDIDPHLATVTITNAVRSLQQRLILRSRVLLELRSDEHSRMMNELIRYLLNGIAA